eukprot:m.14781 g.14781  ORF g.14781 m.14781 type:complete len:344 (+) comp5204_c0_seq1:330-1361(+)
MSMKPPPTDWVDPFWVAYVVYGIALVLLIGLLLTCVCICCRRRRSGERYNIAYQGGLGEISANEDGRDGNVTALKFNPSFPLVPNGNDGLPMYNIDVIPENNERPNRKETKRLNQNMVLNSTEGPWIDSTTAIQPKPTLRKPPTGPRGLCFSIDVDAEIEKYKVHPRSRYSLDPDATLAKPSQSKESANDNHMKGKIYIALHKFMARNEDELTFDIGQKIEILDDPEGGWWKGKSLDSALSGWFPSNHIKPMDPSVSRESKAASKASSAELNARTVSFGWPVHVAEHAFTPRYEDELPLKPGDEVIVIQATEGGWWEAIVETQHGWVPSAYLSSRPKTAVVEE